MTRRRFIEEYHLKMYNMRESSDSSFYLLKSIMQKLKIMINSILFFFPNFLNLVLGLNSKLLKLKVDVTQ